MDKLTKLLGIPSNGHNTLLMTHYLLNELSKLKVQVIVDSEGNIIIEKGKTGFFPTVTAHLDTVHAFSSINITESDGKLTSSAGIGGDDKCGIYIAMQLLQTVPTLKVLFFQGEENGCIGSNGINIKSLSNCGYIIGLDRRGNSDYINTFFGSKTTSEKFEEKIKLLLDMYKYTNSPGLITDSFNLHERKIGISCCNISVGYYEPHTKNEYVVKSEVESAKELVKEMIASLGCNQYPCVYEKYTYAYKPTKWYKSTWKEYLRGNKHTETYKPIDTKIIPAVKTDICDICGNKTWLPEKRIVDGEEQLICYQCKMGIGKETNKGLTTCVHCGKGVETYTWIRYLGNVCDSCMEDLTDPNTNLSDETKDALVKSNDKGFKKSAIKQGKICRQCHIIYNDLTYPDASLCVLCNINACTYNDFPTGKICGSCHHIYNNSKNPNSHLCPACNGECLREQI